MIHATITNRTGITKDVTAEPGTSLKDAILTADFTDVVGLCGGFASCGTCQVYLGDGWAEQLPPPDETEEMLLESSLHRKPSSRYACQITLTDALDGITATLAPEE